MPTKQDAFVPQDWRLITGLPRRVGRWMAELDQGGGEATARAEVQSIRDFLDQAYKKFELTPLVAEIVLAARTGKTGPADEFDLLVDCATAVARMGAIAEPVEVNAYKLLLIEMAEAVARAGPDRDYGPHNLQGGAERGWYGLYPVLVANMTRYGRGPNVSRAEKMGINRLIDKLDAGQIVEKWVLIDEAPAAKIAKTGNF